MLHCARSYATIISDVVVLLVARVHKALAPVVTADSPDSLCTEPAESSLHQDLAVAAFDWNALPELALPWQVTGLLQLDKLRLIARHASRSLQAAFLKRTTHRQSARIITHPH